MLPLATFLVLLLTAGIVVFLLVRIWRDVPDRAELARLQTRDADYRQAAQLLQECSARVLELEAARARLESDLVNERRINKEKLQLLAEAEARLKPEFESLARRIMDDQGKLLTEGNRERIALVLQPLKEQIETFRNRLETVHNTDLEQSALLRNQIEQLQQSSAQISADANNLALAIKGDAKRQGDWGELLIGRILEASGLQPEVHYEEQKVLRTEDDSRVRARPDFIINLPQEKVIVLDSKVSLTAFDRYCAADDEESRDHALAEHVQSVRRHIAQLQETGYEQYLGNRTLDFVLLCIPVEPAFQAALQADPELLYDSAGGRVVITGPTTLMLSLKLIVQIWRRENENKNAEEIAARAGRMYDQVVLITESLLDAQKKLGAAAEAIETTRNRLTDGRGNLLRRVEELRRLGAKTSKTIPPELASQNSDS